MNGETDSCVELVVTAGAELSWDAARIVCISHFRSKGVRGSETETHRPAHLTTYRVSKYYCDIIICQCYILMILFNV